jgi:CopG family transcriptional regulator, nickel-responsive regulator
MSKLTRFGVAVEADLLARFDRVIERKGYANRSEALRDVMRERLIEEAWRSDADTVGVITLVYDHSVRELQARLTELQHQLAGQVISTLHVHIDADHCLEVILVRGTGEELGRFADRLVGLKGVVYGRLLPATLGHGLWKATRHGHDHGPGHPHDHPHGHPRGHPHEARPARRRRPR